MGPAIVPLFWSLIRTPPEKRDPKTVQSALEKTGNAWSLVDRYLAGNRYIVGDALTLGDIPLGVWAYRWFNLPVERPRFENVEAWYKRICERPAYRKHIMIPLT